MPGERQHLSGYALVEGWRRTVWCKVVGVALAAAYLLAMVPADRSAVGWWCDRSLAVKRMVLGVARAMSYTRIRRFCWMAWQYAILGGPFFHRPFSVLGISTFTSHRGQKVTLTGILNKATSLSSCCRQVRRLRGLKKSTDCGLCRGWRTVAQCDLHVCQYGAYQLERRAADTYRRR